MKVYLVILFTVIAICNAQERVNEDEVIFVELYPKHTNETWIAQLRIHVVNGTVNLNGNPLAHNVVNNIHTYVHIAIVEKGIQQKDEVKNARLRLLVVEQPNENDQHVLHVEEEFVEVEGLEVTQREILRVIFVAEMRKPVEKIMLKQSKLFSRPVENDRHVYLDSSPEVSTCWGNFKEHCFRSVKCWYNHLHLFGKIAVFLTMIILLLLIFIACCICVKRRNSTRRRKLKIQSPVYNTLAVDIDQSMQTKHPPSKPYHDFTKEIDMYFEYDSKNDKLPLFAAKF